MPDKKELTAISGGLKIQDQLLTELDNAANNMGQTFSEYGKKCVVNAIAQLVIYTKQNGCSLQDFDETLLRLALQNIGYTELNVAAIPSECYLDIRKSKDGKKTLSIKPQGAGYEKLLRTYGVGVKDVKTPWLVREGDEFTYPSFNGLEMTPPKWTPKSYDKKVVMVVYPVIKTDDTVEFLIATREGIKPNIVAQIRQNCLYDKDKDRIYAQINEDAEKLTVDELLAKKEWADIINPTYISGGSKEQMIIRKMKNNATKNYPKEYRDSYMADAVKDMYEDKDESLDVKPKVNVVDAEVTIDKVEEEIAEKPKGDAVADFDVDDDGVVKDTAPQSDAAQEEIKRDEDYGF